MFQYNLGEAKKSDSEISRGDLSFIFAKESKTGIDLVDGAELDDKTIKGTDIINDVKGSTSPTQERLSTDSTEPSLTASLLEELSAAASTIPKAETEQSSPLPPQPTRMGVQSDGTVILPKISDFYGRILVCVLALFLSILNAKRILITFASWEVAYYFLNGLPPLPPPNMAMVVAAVMGLKEGQLNRIKKIVHFGNCVLVDFSLFTLFSLMPHIIRSFVSL